MSENIVSVRVWGDFACFTRPEMKVERVSYPVMTPSAARGVLEAIFWEPQMYYLIDSIRVVKKGRWVSFRRNEVKSVVSIDSAQTWMKSPEKFSPIQAGGGAPHMAQRSMLALEDVEYVISAEVHLSQLGRAKGLLLKKYVDELRRRAGQGKCYHRPALGVREFAADFEGVDDLASVSLADWPEEDLGIMLYDVFDPRMRDKGFRWLTEEEMHAADPAGPAIPATRGRRGAAGQVATSRWEGAILKPQACFFRASAKNATVDCHPSRVEILAHAGKEAV